MHLRDSHPIDVLRTPARLVAQATGSAAVAADLPRNDPDARALLARAAAVLHGLLADTAAAEDALCIFIYLDALRVMLAATSEHELATASWQAHQCWELLVGAPA